MLKRRTINSIALGSAGALVFFGLLYLSASLGAPIEPRLHVMLSDYGAIIGASIAAAAAFATITAIREQVEQQQKHFDQVMEQKARDDLDEESREYRFTALSMLRIAHTLLARHNALANVIAKEKTISPADFHSIPKPSPVTDSLYGALTRLRGSDGIISLVHLDMASQKLLPENQDVTVEALKTISKMTAHAGYVAAQLYFVAWVSTYRADRENANDALEGKLEDEQYAAFAKDVLEGEGGLPIARIEEFYKEAGHTPFWKSKTPSP